MTTETAHPTWALAATATAIRDDLLQLEPIPKAHWNGQIENLIGQGRAWPDIVRLVIAAAADPATATARRLAIPGLIPVIDLTTDRRRTKPPKSDPRTGLGSSPIPPTDPDDVLGGVRWQRVFHAAGRAGATYDQAIAAADQAIGHTRTETAQ